MAAELNYLELEIPPYYVAWAALYCQNPYAQYASNLGLDTEL